MPCPATAGDNKGQDGGEKEEKVATAEQYEHALSLAKSKYESVSQPSEDDVEKARAGMAKLGANKYRKNLVGNSKDRAKRRKALLDEFGDGQHCPCIYCGVMIGEGTLEQDKILTTGQGGKYRLPNLVPACSRCNKNRSDMSFGDAMRKLEELSNA